MTFVFLDFEKKVLDVRIKISCRYIEKNRKKRSNRCEVYAVFLLFIMCATKIENDRVIAQFRGRAG